MTTALATEFRHSNYVVRRKIFSILGQKFHVYDGSGRLAFYSRQKAFRLKEDLRIYSDESMQTEVLVIKARNIIDFGATYDVFDPRAGGTLVGSLRRKAMKSILADEWLILDASGREVGLITEDSVALALLRRLVAGWLLPQHYNGAVGGQPVFEFHRNFNPFVSKMQLDFSKDRAGALDRRLGIAAAILLVALEGKQQG